MPPHDRAPQPDGPHVLPTPVPVTDVVDGEVLVGDVGHTLSWDIDERIREVEAAVAGVDRQVRASRRDLALNFLAGWAGFRGAWRDFRGTTLRAARQGRVRWSDVYELVIQYEQRVTQWRRAAEERGVRFVTAAGAPRPRPPESSAWDEAKPVAIAAAVGLSALAVIAIVNKLS